MDIIILSIFFLENGGSDRPPAGLLGQAQLPPPARAAPAHRVAGPRPPAQGSRGPRGSPVATRRGSRCGPPRPAADRRGPRPDPSLRGAGPAGCSRHWRGQDRRPRLAGTGPGEIVAAAQAIKGVAPQEPVAQAFPERHRGFHDRGAALCGPAPSRVNVFAS